MDSDFKKGFEKIASRATKLLRRIAKKVTSPPSPVNRGVFGGRNAKERAARYKARTSLRAYMKEVQHQRAYNRKSLVSPATKEKLRAEVPELAAAGSVGTSFGKAKKK